MCLSLYLTCFTDSLGNGGRYNFTFSVPKHFNYISFQVQRFSNQGADIDACVDKAANIQNEINKDFEEGVTANFAQCSASNFDQYIDLIFIMFFILREINSVFASHARMHKNTSYYWISEFFSSLVIVVNFLQPCRWGTVH